jgi:hypothetical protein
VHPGDASESLLWLVPVASALVAAAICVIGLVRGRLGETLFVTGVAFLPALAFALSDVVLMERSTQTEFCTSCHLMQPVHDSTVDENDSLASIHVTRGAVPTATSCYTCHSGYGMWGTLDAKLAGTRHMLHTVLGSYELPLKHHGTYNIDSCLSCHAESSRFRSGDAQAAHLAVEESLLAGEMTCTGMCHPAAHPPEALTGEEFAR